MARTDPSFNLRIPSELKDRLELTAKESGRSVTQEIIKRLEDSFSENKINLSINEIEDLLEFVRDVKQSTNKD